MEPFRLHFFSWGPMMVAWLFWYVLPAVASAYFAYKDASKREVLALGIPPVVWALVCIPSGVLGLLAYWLMNHSTLVSAVKQS